MKIDHKMKHICAVLMSICVLFQSAPISVSAQENVISIETIDDWETFAKNCTLDTWSQGIQVVLEDNLTLTGSEIVPTFGGTFDGNGHTISILGLSREGSHQGLFRYVQENAVIQNLTVVGLIAPSGNCSAVGGIVGTNYGTITQCAFRGTVDGKTGVGGIAGVNEASGTLLNCTVNGNISGEHYTGGIVGENYGSVVLCTNRAAVNTHETDVSPDLDTLDWTHLNDVENIPSCTDTGGIAGFSKGILQNCVNSGAVGYLHTGYNVGGIVGRQAGYVDGCTNSGSVAGRKDVGGIVGQMEPYTLLQFQQDTISQILDALDVMSGLMDTTLTHSQSSGQDISEYLTEINGLTDDTRENLISMAEDIENWSGGATDTVNELSARISRVLRQSSPILQDFDRALNQVGIALDQTIAAIDTVDVINDPNSAVYQDISNTLKALKASNGHIRDAVEKINDALETILNTLGDDTAVSQGVSQLASAFPALSEGLDSAAEEVKTLSDLMTQLSVDEADQASLNLAAGALAESGNALSDLSAASERSGDAVSSFLSFPGDEEMWDDFLEVMADVMKDMAAAGDDLEQAFTNAQAAMEQLHSIFDAASDQLMDSLSAMSIGTDALQSGSQKLEKLIREQANAGVLELPQLDSGFHEKQDQLNTSLASISGKLEDLNQSANKAGSQLAEDLQNINKQFTVIIQLMRESADSRSGEGDYIVDISSEADAAVMTGKVTQCLNRGSVEGDIDIGGLAGAMSIEFDFDPEDDMTKEGSFSSNVKYLTQAVLQDSINYGDVTARKNDVGGAVGWMSLGIVSGCESYGDLESTDGGYVGGIAGYSEASIQNCWVKSHISGQRYIGGIAGYGTNLYQCYAFASIDTDAPYVGAIAGEADGVLSQNYYVGDTLGGIDGISYDGKAQSIRYEELVALPEVPDELKVFSLTFMADDHIITSRVFHYGDALTADRMPEVPKKDGCYGEWEPFDTEHLVFDMTIHAQYTPWTTALSNVSGSVLAEGTFTPEITLTAEPSVSQLPDGVEPAAVWTVRLSDEGQEFTALRIAIPDDVRHPTVWVKEQDGDWRKTDCEQDGSYVRIPYPANSLEVCVTGTDPNWWSIALWIGCGIVGAVLLIGGGIFVKKKKNTK